tara:strand:- start:17937 stop:18641 length:705 start_codon:yes stop_codon:yes gene_type:complete
MNIKLVKEYKIIKNNNDFYKIVFNNKYFKTPLGNVIKFPSLKIAKIFLKKIKSSDKNQSQTTVSEIKLVYMAIDKIALSKSNYINNIAMNIQTDVICFFSSEQKSLYLKQKKLWLPLIQWMKDMYKVQILYSSTFKVHIQTKNNIERLKKIIKKYNIYELSALHTLIGITNSFVISLALLESKISYKKAFELSFLEELYQSSIWGEDEEALERLNSIKLDIKLVKDYFDAVNAQ